MDVRVRDLEAAELPVPRLAPGWLVLGRGGRGYGRSSAQVFAMYYLTDTRRENGCLRVLPGSHVAPHPLHDDLGRAHSDEVRSAGASPVRWQDLPDHKNDIPGALDVPVRAGDLVLGDARMLHGAWPNSSSQRRTVITLWYLPNFATRGESMRRHASALHRSSCGELYRGDWSDEALRLLLQENLLPPSPDDDAGTTSGAPGEKKRDDIHNLGFMDRTPGHANAASDAARAAFAAAAQRGLIRTGRSSSAQ